MHSNIDKLPQHCTTYPLYTFYFLISQRLVHESKIYIKAAAGHMQSIGYEVEIKFTQVLDTAWKTPDFYQTPDFRNTCAPKKEV